MAPPRYHAMRVKKITVKTNMTWLNKIVLQFMSFLKLFEDFKKYV
jgi:hypothetical protein